MTICIFIWETLINQNLREWPVWCLLIPTFFWTLLALATSADLWVAAILASFLYLPYMLFWAEEQMKHPHPL
jgi:hypothetical protein